MPKNKTKGDFYSPDDLAIMKRDYPQGDLKSLAARLGRTLQAIQTKASKLGLQRSVFTDKERSYLKRYYPSLTLRHMADHLGKPLPTVKSEIRRLGLKKRTPLP